MLAKAQMRILQRLPYKSTIKEALSSLKGLNDKYLTNCANKSDLELNRALMLIDCEIVNKILKEM